MQLVKCIIEVEFIFFWLSAGPVMDYEEIVHLLQSLGHESDLDSTDDEIAVDTVEQIKKAI